MRNRMSLRDSKELRLYMFLEKSCFTDKHDTNSGMLYLQPRAQKVIPDQGYKVESWEDLHTYLEKRHTAPPAHRGRTSLA